MLTRSTIIITALLALGAAPATALATSQNDASTHAYILANAALVRKAEASVRPVQASVVALNQRLGQECPKVGAGSPENDESQKVSYEVTAALWSLSYGAYAGPIDAFARAVKPLRWSNPKLTQIAQHYAKSLRELAAIAMPDLCGDVRAWSASDFRSIPANTLRIDQLVEPIEGHTIPPRLLAPYVRPAEEGVLAHTTRLETKLEQTETVTGFSDWDMLLETLGLNQ
jgi:hypothetical protein